MSEPNSTVSLIAALVAGDRWLNADACAVYLGMVKPDGEPNRRGFLERVACSESFPQMLPGIRTWKLSEIDRWRKENPDLSVFTRERTEKEKDPRPSHHPKAGQQTCLYRHFDGDGRLLYVGVSLSAAARLSRHSVDSGWFRLVALVTLEWHPNRSMALAAERAAIRSERPEYNVLGAVH